MAFEEVVAKSQSAEPKANDGKESKEPAKILPDDFHNIFLPDGI